MAAIYMHPNSPVIPVGYNTPKRLKKCSKFDKLSYKLRSVTRLKFSSKKGNKSSRNRLLKSYIGESTANFNNEIALINLK
jgi:hypothetical protein